MVNKRYFVVSDLHGDGIMYHQIIDYLENLQKECSLQVILYILGDVIDRGPNSISMLLDVMKRENGEIGNIEVHLLAGNHEYMMNQALQFRLKNNKWFKLSTWFLGGNGGKKTALEFDELSSIDQESIAHYIHHLPVYHKFSQEIDHKNILLVHAMAPRVVKDDCDLFLSNKGNGSVYHSLWTRKEDMMIPMKLGLKDYLTIIGHTPIDNRWGYQYYSSDLALNIDGGCAAYVLGYTDLYNHTPLLELNFDEQRISILIFNHQNEIFAGKYFTHDARPNIEEERLDYYRSFLSGNYSKRKVKK